MRIVGLCVAILVSVGEAGSANAQDVKSYLHDVDGRLVGSAHTRAEKTFNCDSYSFDPVDNRARRDAQTVALRAVQNKPRPGKALVRCPSMVALDECLQLAMWADGNVALYVGSTLRWAFNTGGKNFLRLEMQYRDPLPGHTQAHAPIGYVDSLAPGAKLILTKEANAMICSSAEI